MLIALVPLRAQTPLAPGATNPEELFAADNLHAWCAVPFDAKQRGPEERAAMLQRLGFKRFVYDWRAKDIPAFDAEFEAMKKHGVEVTGWWSPTDPRDPVLLKTLNVFKRQNVHPQLWVMGSGSLTKTPAEQQQRVEQEAERIRAIADLARPYGSKVQLYNHNGWFGIPDNEIAIIERLKQLGTTDVGMVYNFSHGHNDIADFPAVWKRMKPYVVAVNVTGMVPDGESKIMPPSQGYFEQSMLRVILESGWRGPIGLIAEQGGDAEVTLGNYLRGLEWLKKEFVKRGSGGPKPDFAAAARAVKQVLPEREPLIAAAHPLHGHPVNRDRIYDFYAKQAREWHRNPAPLLPEFPDLDSGRYGHWGNQNEAFWKDGRWNEMDIGWRLAGVFHGAGITVPKAVCVRLGEKGERSACYDPVTNQWRAVWEGGFIKFSATRHGLMDGLPMNGKPTGDILAKASSTPRKYRGFYQYGERTIFAFDMNGAEELMSAKFEDGKVQLESGETLRKLTKGGPALWPQILETPGVPGKPVPGWPYVVDTLTLPIENPWRALFFIGGHDFFVNGDIAICTMTGDVWRVSGVDVTLSKLRWKRMATGLHQPLGLVIVEDKVCVLGRDQITRLHDLNSDGEADFYECLSNEFTTPTGGHDFVCGLERDALGNFYTASGKEGLLRILPGKKAEVMASGFRNPDGLGLAPDGTLTVPYSEGEWTPTSAIAQIVPGGYYGYPGPRAGSPTLPPLVWLPRGEDNSAGGQTWVPDDRWGPMRGQMLHFSYGAGTHFLVLRQKVKDVWQGAAIPLPGDFNAGAHRARFSPHDGQLYVSGMTGWGTYTPDDGCLQRLRYTGGPVQIPTAIEARDNGVLLTFSEKPEATGRYFAQTWNYRYSPSYGSKEYSLSQPDKAGHDVLEIKSAHVLGDGRQLFLEIPQIQPANMLHLHCDIAGLAPRDMFFTVHQLGTPFTEFPNYTAIAKTMHAAHAPVANVAAQPVKWEQGAPGRELRIQTAAALQFVQKELQAKAGERLSLILENPDVMQHNWVLLKPESTDRVGELANKMISAPDALSRNYVPDSPDVIVHTRVVDPQKTTTIHFTAPAQAGRYPFVCTFPGHWAVMRGILVVE